MMSAKMTSLHFPAVQISEEECRLEIFYRVLKNLEGSGAGLQDEDVVDIG